MTDFGAAAAAHAAAIEEGEMRLRTVVPPEDLPAWMDRAWREERRMIAAAVEGVAAYVPGSGFRIACLAAARGERP